MGLKWIRCSKRIGLRLELYGKAQNRKQCPELAIMINLQMKFSHIDPFIFALKTLRV